MIRALRSPRRMAAVLISAGGCAAVLVACGGSGGGTASSTGSAGASAAVGNGAARGSQLFSDPKVQACLKAAGLSVPSFGNGARPSGSFTGRPSGAPDGNGDAVPSGNGAPPSGGTRPSRAGGGQNSAEFQKIEAAFKACGITLPTNGRGGAPTGTAHPTHAPAS